MTATCSEQPTTDPAGDKLAAQIMTTEMNAPGYEKLAGVLLRAYEQASAGKGKERHASDGVPFEGQPISAINRTLGSIDGLLYQASKKAMESRRLPAGRAQAELLGAIVYLSAAVIAFDTWAAGTLPAGDAGMPEAQPGADKGPPWMRRRQDHGTF